MASAMPLAQAETQTRLWNESVALWGSVLGQFAGHGSDEDQSPQLPREDRRFADPRWKKQPVFALLHQTYLMLAERLQQMAEETHGLSPERKGQLTHTDPDAFELGRNIAVTPGKVVYETPLYQLIQYSPATPDVLAVPLLIFPPWINRFYILDLN